MIQLLIKYNIYLFGRWSELKNTHKKVVLQTFLAENLLSIDA